MASQALVRRSACWQLQPSAQKRFCHFSRLVSQRKTSFPGLASHWAHVFSARELSLVWSSVLRGKIKDLPLGPRQRRLFGWVQGMGLATCHATDEGDVVDETGSEIAINATGPAGPTLRKAWFSASPFHLVPAGAAIAADIINSFSSTPRSQPRLLSNLTSAA